MDDKKSSDCEYFFAPEENADDRTQFNAVHGTSADSLLGLKKLLTDSLGYFPFEKVKPDQLLALMDKGTSNHGQLLVVDLNGRILDNRRVSALQAYLRKKLKEKSK